MEHVNTTAVIAIIIAAGSEIIGLLPIKSNTWIQLVIKALITLFPKRWRKNPDGFFSLVNQLV